MKVGDMVTQWPQEVEEMDLGVGIVLEVLNGGYARKNASALVYWTKIEATSFHAEPSLIVHTFSCKNNHDMV